MREISICFLRRKTCEASSPSSSISLTRMDSLPDGVVQYILSKLSNAKDVASCNCVSKKWKDSMSYRKSLCFPRGIFDNLTGPQTPDSIVMQMVSSVSRLEELVVSCHFTIEGLTSWLLVVGSSLKSLELRVAHAPNRSWLTLNCIKAARNLESLRLWHVVMTHTPKWDVFHKLRNLEIRGATLKDSVLTKALRATPNLTQLVLDGCKGLSVIWIELLHLQHCRLNIRSSDVCSVTLRAPKIQYVEVKGCNRIGVHDTDFLKTLSIHNNLRSNTIVDLGDNLMALELLRVRGGIWRWDVINERWEQVKEDININTKAPARDAGADAFPEEMHRLFQDSTTGCHVIHKNP